jgi:hypothetical protein
MRSDAQRGSVVISVDVSAAQQQATADVPRLLDLFDRLGIAATWALDEGVSIDLARQISVRTVGHQLALLADPGVLHSHATRGQVVRYITARQQQLAEAQLTATSLVGHRPAVGWLERDADLLAKHGITTVRFDDDRDDASSGKGRLRAVRGMCDWLWASGAPMVRPVSVRFGVWSLPGSMSVPASPVHTRLAADVARACRSVETAATDGGLFHLVVGLEQLLERGSRGESSLEAVLKRAAEARSQGRIDVATTAEATGRFAHPPRRAPAARSILRPSAA